MIGAGEGRGAALVLLGVAAALMVLAVWLRRSHVYAALDTGYPSTMLRMVPLPVPGRSAYVRTPPKAAGRPAMPLSPFRRPAASSRRHEPNLKPIVTPPVIPRPSAVE